MASITNRSKYIVEVADAPQFTRTFPHTAATKAKRYKKELAANGQSGLIRQLEDNFLLRIRDKGYPEYLYKAGSYEEAERELQRVLGDRAHGRRVDYTKARRITLAQLIDQYLQEESPKHKGHRTEVYTLGAFLEDIHYLPYLKRKQEERQASGKPERNYARHERRTAIEWLQKPFADLEPPDFNRYVNSRQSQGFKNATIDREFDLLAQVINWAIHTQRYHVEIHPLKGFKRPTYFNERDRRLRGDEGDRLLASVREEDRVRSFKIAVEQRIDTRRREGPPRAGKSWNKYFTMQIRRRARTEVKQAGCPHIPFWEALIEYLLATASRRGEALALTWDNTYLTDNMATYPDTKNGRSRSVPVRQHVVDLLLQLPRCAREGRVFPVTGDEVDGAWSRICKRAGIKGFRIHDNRHEGLSKTAETMRAAGRPLDVITLAALSGHRDLSSLARYMNQFAGELAREIDYAESLVANSTFKYHKGRLRGVRARPMHAPPSADQNQPPPAEAEWATRTEPNVD
jgi:integrase